MNKIFTFLFLISFTTIFASKVDTLVVFSKSMQKNISNIVIKPNTYNKNKKLPVLYLLHGAYGNFTDWIKKVPEIKEYADTYQMIIVCPDGNPFSWYFDSPMIKSMRYETYISSELISAIDKNYYTLTSRESRAVTGLSMGGHGAYYLAFKHKNIFGAAGSMSGGMNLVKFSKKWKIAKQLGNYEQHPENWKKNTIINMIHLIKNNDLNLILDCGIDDFFYQVNKELHLKLLQNNISHSYSENPGKHNWSYWRNSIKYHMVFFDTFFKSRI